jgi:DNA invertase Pin-like site-specific DNA recombinase
MIHAVGYMRTSSATNVGEGKDSEPRQRAAISAYAEKAGYVIAEDDWYYDAAVRGADSLDAREGFIAMLARIEANGVRTIIVETANRFARDLMVQEIGFKMLRKAGIALIAADSPSTFLDDGPTSTMLRQILGVVAEFEKASMVAKLKGARDRKRMVTGKKVSGRKNYAEMRPAVVERARWFAVQAHPERTKAMPHRALSLREISAALANEGHLTPSGRPYAPMAVRSMLRTQQQP